MKREKYPHVQIALQYAKDVVAKRVPASKWTQLACKRHLNDLKKKRWKYRFDPEKAEQPCRFIELLPHTKGKWAAKSERITLEPWQVFIVCVLFGWVRKDGTRRFREAYIEVPRKNGKSLLFAAIGLYCLTADGEHGAEVYSGATSEKQAWEIFRPARLMALRTPDLLEHYGVEIHAASLSIADKGSRFEPVIGNPGDGASPSCALIDEFHEHASPELYDTMTTGMGAREQALTGIITTSGSNLAGPCYEKHCHSQKVLDGTIEDDELFCIIFTIDEGDDWTSDEALRKANPNYGVSLNEEYLLSRRRRAMQLASQQNIFKTKHLNIWVGARSGAFDMRAWGMAPARKPLDQLVGRPCYMPLDLASKIDIAAQILLFPPTDDDPLWHVHGKYYLPEDTVEEHATTNQSHYAAWARQGHITLTPGNVIDFEYIMESIRDCSSRFQVEEVPYDPWQATQLATQMVGEGAPMVEMRQTVQNLSEPMKLLQALVISKKLAHGGCPVLTWMMSNVVAKLDAKDNIYPRKETAEAKIDGAVALIMGLARATVASKNNGSVYDTRGVVAI